MNYVQLLEDVKQELTHLFHAHTKEGCVYHNISHTENVVSRAGEIGRFYQLDDRDFFTVVTAAWFHDVGYYTGQPVGHEQRGAELAENFLKSKGLDDESIQKIKGCIMATQMPQQPHGLLEQIVCDADLYHLGTPQFAEMNKKMRKEVEWRTGKKISKQDWREGAVTLLEGHHYHTDYAKGLLDEKKQENLDRIRQKQAEENVTEKAVIRPVTPIENLPKTVESSPVKKEKSDRPDRGIETMFRISSTNHQRLSDMADNKANIMITTTSIILSVLLSVLLRKLEDNPQLVIPTLLLLTVCVVTMVFAILATRPSLPDGRFTEQDVDSKKVNLLFFGNFYRMTYDEYSKGMAAMMNDRDFLYGSLTKDVYSQGIVLGRKYRLLRIGYNVFMFGIIVSVLAFVIAEIFF
ncbi:MAG: Pycsar system effector family protein [Bacteroidota bacterium]